MVSHISLERKRRSEAILRMEGVPFIAHLPVIEDEETTQIRPLEEVAWRAMALNVVAVRGEGLELGRVLEIIEQYNLEHALTPKEREFIVPDALVQNYAPSVQDFQLLHTCGRGRSRARCETTGTAGTL